MWTKQEETVIRLFEAARRNGLEFLLEVIPSKVAAVDALTTAQVIRHWYKKGVYPDWWKLEPMQSALAWEHAIKAIEQHDSHTRGIVVLGLDAPEAELKASFEVAAQFDLVKGFAVGRTIFADSAKAWFKGELTDQDAIDQMAQRYERLCKNIARHQQNWQAVGMGQGRRRDHISGPRPDGRGYQHRPRTAQLLSIGDGGMGHGLFIVAAVGGELVFYPVQRFANASHIAMAKNRPRARYKGLSTRIFLHHNIADHCLSGG